MCYPTSLAAPSRYISLASQQPMCYPTSLTAHQELHPVTMDLGAFHLEGFSLGGIETALYVPGWRLAIDVGRGRGSLLRAKHIAITHTHIDHAGGLPYLLALRQLYGMDPPTIYVPAQSAAGFAEMLAAWDKIQRFTSRYELVEARPGEAYPIGRGLELLPFRTYHVVPSVGYRVRRTTHKLLPSLRGLPGREIAARKARGEPITAPETRVELAVTGDTLPELFDRTPDLYEARVLVTECTFLDDRKPYAAARAGGHVHLRDLLARADHFANRQLVLSHFSQIYKPTELPKLLRPLAERVAPELLTLPMTLPDDRRA